MYLPLVLQQKQAGSRFWYMGRDFFSPAFALVLVQSLITHA